MTIVDSIAMWIGYTIMGATLIPLFVLLLLFALSAAAIWTQQLFSTLINTIKTFIERTKL